MVLISPPPPGVYLGNYSNTVSTCLARSHQCLDLSNSACRLYVVVGLLIGMSSPRLDILGSSGSKHKVIVVSEYPLCIYLFISFPSSLCIF